jgi:hypothetical protein
MPYARSVANRWITNGRSRHWRRGCWGNGDRISSVIGMHLDHLSGGIIPDFVDHFGANPIKQRLQDQDNGCYLNLLAITA